MCADFYFIGMIDIARIIWYGYAKNSDSITNFSNVYTTPAHHKKSLKDRESFQLPPSGKKLEQFPSREMTFINQVNNEYRMFSLKRPL